eukprot:6139535-Pleurochrysis_carterae.AAC.1
MSVLLFAIPLAGFSRSHWLLSMHLTFTSFLRLLLAFYHARVTSRLTCPILHSFVYLAIPSIHLNHGVRSFRYVAPFRVFLFVSSIAVNARPFGSLPRVHLSKPTEGWALQVAQQVTQARRCASDPCKEVCKRSARYAFLCVHQVVVNCAGPFAAELDLLFQASSATTEANDFSCGASSREAEKKAGETSGARSSGLAVRKGAAQQLGLMSLAFAVDGQEGDAVALHMKEEVSGLPRACKCSGCPSMSHLCVACKALSEGVFTRSRSRSEVLAPFASSAASCEAARGALWGRRLRVAAEAALVGCLSSMRLKAESRAASECEEFQNVKRASECEESVVVALRGFAYS